MFLTYEEYTALGYSQVDEADFPRLERQAAQYIRSRTMNRAKLGAGHDEELKEATALIMEQLQSDFNASANGAPGPISGESKDGWSVSYAVTNSEIEAKMAEQRKRQILSDYLLWTGWLSAVIPTCPPRQIFPPLPGPKPPKPEPPGGGEDMFKLCWVFYRLDNFEGGFDSTGNNLIFPGGPVRIVTADDSKVGTVAGGTLPYVHAQYFRINVDTFDISVGEWPTEPNLRACGYMHNNGPKKIIEVFGMGTQVWGG